MNALTFNRQSLPIFSLLYYDARSLLFHSNGVFIIINSLLVCGLQENSIVFSAKAKGIKRGLKI